MVSEVAEVGRDCVVGGQREESILEVEGRLGISKWGCSG